MVKKRAVEVVPYNPNWPDMFQQEATKIQAVLGDNCIKVLHIGSTSIPGLAAKPIIDIIPVVKNIYAVDDKTLQSIGYTCIGESGMLFRKHGHKYETEARFHLHIWEENNAEIDKHILFRQYLIDHPEDLKTYEALKLKLAKQFPDDGRAYALSKDSLLKEILSKTGFKGKLIVQALTEKEWNAYHRIKKEQIFDKLSILYNITHPTITATNHFHFVLSLGVDVVGIAHIKILDETRASLKHFAVDTPHQNQGLGTWLLNQLERWMYHKNIHLIALHANPEAVLFYKQLGYSEMPFLESKPLKGGCIDLGKILVKK